ncbi:MAG: flagellar type III secretion system protein FlhB [Gammaproteobacteria bacterium]|nr:MAG: flagellar type III secretion system protein FlhB [Gammaproteobacteria bacterium]
MAEEQAQERTEEPTPKRLREAREKGQVARSRELNTTLVLLTGAFALFFSGPFMLSRLEALVAGSFEIDRQAIFDTQGLPAVLMSALGDALLLITPLLAFLLAAAILGPMSLGGWAFSLDAVRPKLEKLDPIKGLGRIFSLKGLMELAKTLAKFVVVTVAAALLLWMSESELLQLGGQPISLALAHTAQILLWGFFVLTGVLVLIAAIDVPFQLWDHHRQLRMTRQEVKDELKETEGNPEMRAKVRQIQREMAQQRMMAEVPKADVVITNPTHFAVALKYDQRQGSAPRVVARGADLVAREIRSIALQANVPVFEAPPLARALYWNTRLGQEIPADLYLAVAQVLAYIYQLRAFRKGGAYPQPPTDLEVPPEMQRPPHAGPETEGEPT